MKTNIYNIIILDESGSMQSIIKQAMNGYNETLQTIKAAQVKHVETQQHFVTLVSFNSSQARMLYDKAPIEQAREIDYKTYYPDCGTPLYDAMGTTLTKFKYSLDESVQNNVLVTIITDGEENSSVEYNSAMIKKLVDELKGNGWVFTYIGANQDVMQVAEALSITNVMGFEATGDGTQAMFKTEKNSRARYYDRVANNVSNDLLQSDFFKEEE